MLMLLEWSSSLTGSNWQSGILKAIVRPEPPLAAPNPHGFCSWPTSDDQLPTLESESHHPMRDDKLYLIRFKGSDVSIHVVIAARAEIHGEHVVFLRGDGTLAALFVLEIVESWSEFELYNA
jgi:hypothetical protein